MHCRNTSSLQDYDKLWSGDRIRKRNVKQSTAIDAYAGGGSSREPIGKIRWVRKPATHRRKQRIHPSVFSLTESRQRWLWLVGKTHKCCASPHGMGIFAAINVHLCLIYLIIIIYLYLYIYAWCLLSIQQPFRQVPDPMRCGHQSSQKIPCCPFWTFHRCFKLYNTAKRLGNSKNSTRKCISLTVQRRKKNGPFYHQTTVVSNPTGWYTPVFFYRLLAKTNMQNKVKQCLKQWAIISARVGNASLPCFLLLVGERRREDWEASNQAGARLARATYVCLMTAAEIMKLLTKIRYTDT